MTGIYLHNYNDQGQLVPNEGSVENKYVTSPSIPAGSTLTGGPYLYGSDYLTENGTVCTGGIYLFESVPGTRENYLNNTCLVIEGEYKGEPGHYYRMDFTTKEEGERIWLPLLRNHIYNVTITKVDGPGYRDEEDAYKSLPENIETEIVKWNASDMTNIIFDGQYYISTSANPVLLQGMAGSDALQLKTDCPRWKYVLSGNADPEATVTAPGWITITSGHIQGTEYATPSANLTFSFEQNGTGAIREAYIHIWAGRFVVTVTIRQNPWYIGRVSITPDNLTASSGGGQYTVTIQGYYDDNSPIPVRLRTAGGTIIDQATVSGTTVGGLTSGTGVLELSAYWLSTAASRQLMFEYQHPIDNSWVQILAPQQAAYWVEISTSDSDINDFTGWGSYMNITVKGNYPSLPIRFSNIAGTAAVDNSVHPNLPAASHDTSGKTYRVYVPYNDEGNPAYRTIHFQYWDGTYYQSNDEAWTTTFSITQRQGNIVLPEYSWPQYSSSLKPTGNSLGISPARNRVLAHQDYDHLMGTNGVEYNWYRAMGVREPNNMNVDPNTGASSYDPAISPGRQFGTPEDKYLVSEYTPEVRTGCGAYYERDFDKVTDWMLPTYLEANQIKYMHRELQSPAGFSTVDDPNYGRYSSIYTASELSDYYFFDDFGPTSYGALVYSSIISNIYSGAPFNYINPGNQPASDVVVTTSIILMTNAGVGSYMDQNDFYAYYFRKNGSLTGTNYNYINCRCVRQWNPATDVGGPGYTPTFSW